MPKEAALYWHDDCPNHLAAIHEKYFDLPIAEIVARTNHLEKVRTELANAKWLVDQLDLLKACCIQYPEQQQLTSSASKRGNFKTLLKKYFTGEEKEPKVLTLLEEKEREFLALREKKEREFLTTLRLDVFILFCLTFTPTQFETIFHKGLEGVFVEVINKYFEAHWDAFIPCWAAKRVISIIKSESTIKTKSQEAEQLQQGLVPYLSPYNQQATTYTKTSFPTTPSVGTRNTDTNESHEGLNEEHTQTRESHSFQPPSTAWHILPPLTTITTNTEAGALPPPISYSSQPASTVRYNGGHSQNRPIYEHLPQGSNQASESTASIPSAHLLKSFGNYIEQTHVRASKRKRLGDGSQDTSEGDMSAWNGTSVGNQIPTS